MTHDADTAAYIDRCIDPRWPGTLWRSEWGDLVRVLAVDRTPGPHHLWEVDEVGQQVGRKRTHFTPWDYDRNRVISQP